MGICTGSDIKWTDIRPEEITQLQKLLAAIIQQGLGQGATPLPSGFPLTANVDPNAFAAQNIMSKIMGQGAYPYGPSASPFSSFNYNVPRSPLPAISDYGGGGAGSDTINKNELIDPNKMITKEELEKRIAEMLENRRYVGGGGTTDRRYVTDYVPKRK